MFRPHHLARARFFGWMQRAHPEAFARLVARTTANMSGLGVGFSMTGDPTSDSSTTSAESASPAQTASWWDGLGKFGAAALGIYKDVKTFNKNMARADAGKPPLDPSIGASHLVVDVAPGRSLMMPLALAGGALALGYLLLKR